VNGRARPGIPSSITNQSAASAARTTPGQRSCGP
jgi:hypothetical protein